MDDTYVLLSELAAVLDEPANTLAQMFKRGGFTLPDADPRRGTGNWTKFSEADVAVLALIRALTNLGMQVRSASTATQYVIEQGKAELSNLEAFVKCWRDKRLVVSRSDRGWHFNVFEDALEPMYPPAYITLDVAQIVEKAVQRARKFAVHHKAQAMKVDVVPPVKRKRA